MVHAQRVPILGSALGWSWRSGAGRVTKMVGVELDWLETFLAVVDRGGFTAAATQVHRSQSRVSAHIASLEREIGVRLIDRSHRPARITEAGRLFADHAREILGDVRAARSALAAIRQLTDQDVRVSTTAPLGATLFPPVLVEVLAGFPDATVTVTERGRSDDAESADPAVLTVGPADREPVPPARRAVLWWEPLSVLVPAGHEWAGSTGPVTPDLLSGRRPVLGSWIERLIDAPVGPRITVDGPSALAEMVRAGLGVGVLGASSTAAVDLSGLVLVPLNGTDGKRAGFDVAVDWFEVLLSSPIGRALHGALLAAPAPDGAIDRRSRP